MTSLISSNLGYMKTEWWEKERERESGRKGGRERERNEGQRDRGGE